MEIPAWSYFLFWATISVAFSRLGFIALDKPDLSNSASPMVMSLFKHSFAIFTCYSSTHAFIFRSQLKISVHKYLRVYAIALYTLVYYAGGSFPLWYFPIFTWLNLSTIMIIACETSLVSSSESSDFKFNILIHLAVGSSMVLVGENKKLFPCSILCISLFISAFWLSVSEGDEIIFPKLLTVTSGAKQIFFNLKNKRKGKFIEFAIGMVGTIRLQNFFKITSFNHVVAFLYLAVAWLANIALLRAADDLGIFNFLLSNVIVGCTVNQFGLKDTTWIVYGASLLLFGLRVKLESASLITNNREVEVIVWSNSRKSMSNINI